MNKPTQLQQDFLHQLGKDFSGEVRTDPASRLLYSTDASIYQVEPLGVAFPRRGDDLAAALEHCARAGVPVLPRGAGSSLAGQAIGPALILDCSRYLRQIIAIDPEARTAVVDPGVTVSALNQAAAAHGLMFGPDPASADRATMGGSLANNATGAHSILYGMAADHLHSARVVFADGSEATLAERPLQSISLEEMPGMTPEQRLYLAAARLRQEKADAIRSAWPRTWRCASGYTLNYLLPWAASRPPQWGSWDGDQTGLLPYPPGSPDTLNLAPLLCGSEGTLAVIRQATVGLVPRPRYTILAVLAYTSLQQACDDVVRLLDCAPSAVELIPRSMVQAARAAPAYARLVSVLDDLYRDGSDPAALLVVEFSGHDPALLRTQASGLGRPALIAESPADQRRVWDVRKVGMGLLTSRSLEAEAPSFIEDLSVPVERLGEFVHEMERILAEHGTPGEFYAHASAGCLHLRPLVDLKSAAGVRQMRSLAEAAVDLTIRLGGAASGEHGDGQVRAEWLERTFGPEIIAAFRQLKQAADPHGLLNPGKIIDPPPMDTDLRYGPGYQARPWQPVLEFSSLGSGPAGLASAIERCNGAGVCRKDGGVMCPSFQVSQEEMHATRGRANLLRLLVSGQFASAQMGEAAVRQALDLCLACKGCLSECPSGVDVARLKYEFTDHYYRSHRRPLRDYLFGYFGDLAGLGRPFAGLANLLTGSAFFAWFGSRFLGLAPQRDFPRLARRSLTQLARSLPPAAPGAEDVLFLSDAFTEFIHPQDGLAALQALLRAGCRPHLLPVLGAGRTLLSKGFLDPAVAHAGRLFRAVERLDPAGRMPIVGIEPSEVFTLRDEYLDLPGGSFSAEKKKALAGRAFMIDEFLLRPRSPGGRPRLETLLENTPPRRDAPRVYLHGHCYQKAQPPADDGFPTGAAASQALLAAAGYPVTLINSGCCGMAGAFGYEAEHADFSFQVGEQRLFPAVRSAPADAIIAACGASCQPQIEEGAGRPAVHPVRLL
jgi:FAD/FMN-containing dehydrogenase/Fe-S oxidoreductase